jgi:hypothetical protein
MLSQLWSALDYFGLFKGSQNVQGEELNNSLDTEETLIANIEKDKKELDQLCTDIEQTKQIRPKSESNIEKILELEEKIENIENKIAKHNAKLEIEKGRKKIVRSCIGSEDDIQNAFEEFVGTALAKNYNNWILVEKNSMSLSINFGKSAANVMKNDFYGRLSKWEGDKVCDRIIASGKSIVDKISKTTDLVPLTDVKDHKITICVRNSAEKIIHVSNESVLTIGREYKNNTILVPLDISTEDEIWFNHISRVNTLLLLMWDTKLCQIIMFIIDAWSFNGTALVGPNEKIVSEANDECRKLIITKIKSFVQIQVGGTAKYTLIPVIQSTKSIDKL